MGKLLAGLKAAGLAVIGILLFVVRLKNRRIRELESQAMKDRFHHEDEVAEKDLERLEKEFDDAKADLHLPDRK